MRTARTIAVSGDIRACIYLYIPRIKIAGVFSGRTVTSNGEVPSLLHLILVLGGVPVVVDPYARYISLNPPAVADIWHLVWHAPFYGSSEKYCTDFECPRNYDLVEDADTTVCEDHVCTKDVCCEPRGETLWKIPPTRDIPTLTHLIV